MKMFKKLAALLLAAVMVMAVPMAAMAEGDFKIGETNRTFKAYQIFTAVLTKEGDDVILSDIAWGEGVSAAGQAALLDKYGAKDAVELAEKLDGVNDVAAREFAQLVYNYKTTAGTVIKSEETVLTPGYYLIVDETTGQKVDFAFNLSVLKVVNTTPVVIPNKTDIPSVDKKIVEGEDRVVVNEASIGEMVTYEITGKLPTNLSDYETYFYQFNDNLSKGLTFDKTNAELHVTIGDVDVTEYFFVKSADYTGTEDAYKGGTTIVVTIGDLLALNKLDGVEITSKTEVVLTYQAMLNQNALIAPQSNPNEVQLVYSNNPDNSGEGFNGDKPDKPSKEPETTYPTGETPWYAVETLTTEIEITKTDKDGKILTGAEFTLTGEDAVKVILVKTEEFTAAEDGTYYKLADGTFTETVPTEATEESYADTTTKYSKTEKLEVKGEGQTLTDVKGEVGTDGKVKFTGLGAGTYTISESKTPAGYNTIADIEFTVTFDAEAKTFGVKDVTDGQQISVSDNKLATTIVNVKGSTLPETGGIGTTIFYVVGTILVLGAGVTLVAKRRMNNVED